MEDLDTIVDKRVHRESTPVVAAIEARFDVQDTKIDAQNEKIETLTVAVRELTGVVAATNAEVESLIAKVAAQNARIGARNWMFWTVLAFLIVLAVLGVFNYPGRFNV